MSDLIAEIDDAMRRERFERFWKTHGNLVIAFLLAVIIGTGVFSAYRAWDDGVKTAQTERLMDMLGDPSFPSNLTADADVRPGLRRVALLAAGSISLDQKKDTEALGYYTQASQDAKIPADLRQLAMLMRVRLLSAQRDETQDLQALLRDVWQDKKSPWRPHALLESAALYAHRANDLTQARAQLALVMQAQGLPDTLLMKARALDEVYAARQSSADGAGATQ